MVANQPIDEIQAEYAGRGYADFKRDLADRVVAFLAPFQQRYRDLTANPDEIDRLLELGAEKAEAVASKTMADVYGRVGVLPRRR